MFRIQLWVYNLMSVFQFLLVQDFVGITVISFSFGVYPSRFFAHSKIPVCNVQWKRRWTTSQSSCADSKLLLPLMGLLHVAELFCSCFIYSDCKHCYKFRQHLGSSMSPGPLETCCKLVPSVQSHSLTPSEQL